MQSCKLILMFVEFELKIGKEIGKNIKQNDANSL